MDLKFLYISKNRRKTEWQALYRSNTQSRLLLVGINLSEILLEQRMMDNSGKMFELFFEKGKSGIEAIIQIEEVFGCSLPEDYRSFLREKNGGSGWIRGQYFILWEAESIIRLNSEYEVETYASGFLLFGSTGGGEAYAFDLNNGMKVVSIPFIGMSPKDFVAATFTELLERSDSGEEGDFDRADEGVETAGKEVFEITPVLLGGSPDDPDNKAILDRDEHIQAVRYWNRVVRNLRAGD